MPIGDNETSFKYRCRFTLISSGFIVIGHFMFEVTRYFVNIWSDIKTQTVFLTNQYFILVKRIKRALRNNSCWGWVGYRKGCRWLWTWWPTRKLSKMIFTKNLKFYFRISFVRTSNRWRLCRHTSNLKLFNNQLHKSRDSSRRRFATNQHDNE